MKKLIITIVTLMFSASVFAGYTGHSEMGPWVECKIDGKTDYTPQHVCKQKGGTYN